MTLIEKDAFLNPIIKIKSFNIIYIIIFLSILFIILKIIFHKYHFLNNSNNQELARELIHKLPTKDRIINALQIYSEFDIKKPYSDLTIKAINDIENELEILDIKKIKFQFPIRRLYIFCILSLILTTLILTSSKHYDAISRISKKELLFYKPLPFNLSTKDFNAQ